MISKTCAKIIFEGCFEHNADGVRIKKKEEEKDTTEKQILELILQSDIMNIYLEICIALGIIDKKKAEKIKSTQETEIKNS